jgi:broad specificity phosphatase PhoE
MDLANRLEVFLNETYVAHKNDSVLLVTHGGPIQVIRAYLEPASLRQLASEPSIPNCAIRRLVMVSPVSSANLA